jgi:uncharacterized LabA/DUF88 family protein
MDARSKPKPKLKASHPAPEPLGLAPLTFVVYIDGYNLYRGYNHEDPPDLRRLGWCNYQQLGEHLVDISFHHSSAPRRVVVKYFTAPVDSTAEEFKGERQRQDMWEAALLSAAPNVEIIRGIHVGPKGSRREKMTDMNIGLAISKDATHLRPAGMVLISGDRDFQPAIEMAAQQGIPVAVFFPQDHDLYALRPGADYSKRVLITYLTREMLKPYLLNQAQWREYLTLKVRDHKKFQPCLDYENSLKQAVPTKSNDQRTQRVCR